jgi:replicative DNA helicase
MAECVNFDPAAERAVMAGVYAYGSAAYMDVADLLNAESFGVDSNQALWKCYEHLCKDNTDARIDYPSILSAAKSLGISHLFERAGEPEHLRGIKNMAESGMVRLENVRKLAGRVKKLQIARQLFLQHAVAQDNLLKVTGDEPIDQILGVSEQPLIDFTTRLVSTSGDGPRPVGDGLRAYAQYLADNKRDVVGISSGFRGYDRAIGGGFRPGISVIAARPKAGKTQLATNIALRVSTGAYYDWPHENATRAVPVLQLDTEMTREEQAARQLACVSSVTVDDIETGKYAGSPHSDMLLKRAIDKIEKLPYDFLSIAGQPFEETLATMRRWVTRTVGLNADGNAKPCLIIFDYLKLMDSSVMESRHLAEFQVLGFMMTGLHNFAVRYKVPILTFVQLNRDGITVEDTSAVSGSDRIIWLCSNFAIFKKQSDEEIAEQAGQKQVYNRKLVPIVARHGAGLADDDFVHMMLHGAIAQVVEGPTRVELAKKPDSGRRPQGYTVGDTSTQPEVSL